MESREASRTVITYSGDTRWSYLWCFSLLPVMGVSVWIADVTEHASSTIIQLVPLTVFILGAVAWGAAGVVLQVRSRRYLRVVFTIHWTEPKSTWGSLMRLKCRKKGIMACLWPGLRVGLVVSGIFTVLWLLRWVASWLNYSVPVLDPAWALIMVPLLTITIAGLLYLLSYVDAVTSRRTIGLGREWMGYLQGRPGRTLWPYEQVAGVRFDSAQVDGRECRFMVVTAHRGREVAFGLSDEVDTCGIAAFLAEKGVEVSKV